MTRIRLIAALLLLALATVSPLAQVRAEVALRAAIEKETVDGDLKGAIEAYKRIVDGYRDNRPVRAQALLRMAECYQKLGDSQADEVYRRIIREFSDQTAQAAVARAKVGQSGRAAESLTIRRIHAELDLWPDDVSPDGTRIAFTDWRTGNLAVKDIAGQKVFPITAHPLPAGGMFTEFGMSPVFSPDGGQVAYTWCAIAATDCKTTLRISSVTDREPQKPRVVHEGSVWMRPYDWSPDARQIAVLNVEDDRTEIALLDVMRGSIRTLKTTAGGNEPGRMLFSPDGRYLAFDSVIAGSGDDGGRREVFVLPVAGGAERRVAISPPAYRTLVGWSPDGQQLLFISDNRGHVDLYSVTVADGQPQGPALLIKSDLGAVRPLRIARTPALYYATESGGGSRVRQSRFDFSSGAFAEPPASVDDVAPGRNASPQWSPDGRSLAYVHRRQTSPQGRVSVMIRADATGDTRAIPLDLIRLEQLRWAADARSLFGLGTSARGHTGLYRIDIGTGGATLLAAGDALRHLSLNQASTIARFVRSKARRHQFVELDLRSNTEKELLSFEAAGNPPPPQMSADGAKVYYRRAVASASGPAAADVVVERHLASGAERELLTGRIAFLSLSPDGRHVGVRRMDPEGKWVAVSVLPTTGEPIVRDLLRVEHPSGANFAAWSPDGRAVIVNRPGDGTQPDETWWIPLDSRAPRKLDHFMGNIHVHPDGGRIAFQAAGSEPQRSEIWVMEHFLRRMR
jgi:Tol biopolymer transport system component